jgi:protein-disulfide isomerase
MIPKVLSMCRPVGLGVTAIGMTLALLSCGDDSGDGLTATPGTATEATDAPDASAAARSPESIDLAEDFRAIPYSDELTAGYSFGAADAPVVLTMFEDFQCPACLVFNLAAKPFIVQEYVLPGQVRLEFRNFPILGLDSENAAVASQCAADDDRFWEFQKLLFASQYDAGQLQDEKLNIGRFSLERLVEFGAEAGLDPEEFRTCAMSEAAVVVPTEHLREAMAWGFRGTPSFLLDGEPISTPGSVEAWKQVLDEAVAGR